MGHALRFGGFGPHAYGVPLGSKGAGALCASPVVAAGVEFAVSEDEGIAGHASSALSPIASAHPVPRYATRRR